MSEWSTGGLKQELSAAEFDYEAAADPGALYRLYLRVYREQTGGLLPDCNRNSELGALSAA